MTISKIPQNSNNKKSPSSRRTRAKNASSVDPQADFDSDLKKAQDVMTQLQQLVRSVEQKIEDLKTSRPRGKIGFRCGSDA